MFFCSIALSDYIGYMYGAARCPHVIPLVGGFKNLVKKCKTCWVFLFFYLGLSLSSSDPQLEI